jgi:hypothetical protein
MSTSRLIKQKIRQGLINKCYSILLNGYNSMKNDSRYSLSWDEDNITALLIKYMKAVSLTQELNLSITPQAPIYTDEIFSGKEKAKQASVIDIRLSTWANSEEFEYFIEAKNLSEKSWTKDSGSPVNASYYKKRYIETGIDNFVSMTYPDGCLAGYIVQGNLESIVEEINSILVSSIPTRSSEIICNKTVVESYPYCYTSHHINDGKNIALKHFLLIL